MRRGGVAFARVIGIPNPSGFNSSVLCASSAVHQ
jgi:hypothetical protein